MCLSTPMVLIPFRRCGFLRTSLATAWIAFRQVSHAPQSTGQRRDGGVVLLQRIDPPADGTGG